MNGRNRPFSIPIGMLKAFGAHLEKVVTAEHANFPILAIVLMASIQESNILPPTARIAPRDSGRLILIGPTRLIGYRVNIWTGSFRGHDKWRFGWRATLQKHCRELTEDGD